LARNKSNNRTVLSAPFLSRFDTNANRPLIGKADSQKTARTFLENENIRLMNIYQNMPILILFLKNNFSKFREN